MEYSELDADQLLGLYRNLHAATKALLEVCSAMETTPRMIAYDEMIKRSWDTVAEELEVVRAYEALTGVLPIV